MSRVVWQFDPARWCGWAAFVEGAALPLGGSKKIKGDARDYGTAMNDLWDFMATDMRAETGLPHFVGYEQPIMPFAGGKVSFDTVRLSVAIGCTVEMFAKRVKAHAVEIPQSSWRKGSLGYGLAPKPHNREPAEREWSNSEWLKRRAIAVVRGWGIEPEDDNHAEAIVQLDYQLGKIGIKRPWRGE